MNPFMKTKGIRRINNYLLNKLTKAVQAAIQKYHVLSYNNFKITTRLIQIYGWRHQEINTLLPL